MQQLYARTYLFTATWVIMAQHDVFWLFGCVVIERTDSVKNHHSSDQACVRKVAQNEKSSGFSGSGSTTMRHLCECAVLSVLQRERPNSAWVAF